MLRRALRIGRSVVITAVVTIPVAVIDLLFAFMTPRVGLAYEVGLTLCALMLWWRWSGATFIKARTQWSASSRVIGWSAACIAMLTSAHIYWVMPRDIEFMRGVVDSRWSIGATLLAVGLTVPLCEEALFRGYLLSRLRAELAMPTAVVISACTFAFVHHDPTRAVIQLASGVVLACIAIQSGRLWLAVAAHGAINLSGLVNIIVLQLDLPGRAGLAFPCIALLLSAAAAFELRQVLLQTKWASAPGGHQRTRVQQCPGPRARSSEPFQ